MESCLSRWLGFRDHDTLAGCQPIGLKDDRIFKAAEGGLGCFEVVEDLKAGGRNAVPGHEFLGVGLASLKTCSSCAGTEDAAAVRLEMIDDASH